MDNADLAPPEATISANVSQQLKFSAVNDKAFAIQEYQIKIIHSRDLKISNLSISPANGTAVYNAKKRYIELTWPDVPAGTELQATFDAAADIGEYSLVTENCTFSDSSILTVVDALPDSLAPSSPKNVKSKASAGSIAISWNPPTDTDIAAYNIYRRADGSQFTTDPYSTTSALSYTDRNIDADLLYFYKEKGKFVHFEGGWAIVTLRPIKTYREFVTEGRPPDLYAGRKDKKPRYAPEPVTKLSGPKDKQD